jgi:hypothetical protein
VKTPDDKARWLFYRRPRSAVATRDRLRNLGAPATIE